MIKVLKRICVALFFGVCVRRSAYADKIIRLRSVLFHRKILWKKIGGERVNVSAWVLRERTSQLRAQASANGGSD
jgi:hypothetical protein